MSVMNDRKLDELREKRDRMKRIAGLVVDGLDAEVTNKASFRKLQEEYEALLQEFGQHGLALLDTVDAVQAQLKTMTREYFQCVDDYNDEHGKPTNLVGEFDAKNALPESGSHD